MATEDRNDEDLLAIRECLDGNEEAFSRLVNKYKRQAFYIALKIVGNSEDAHDLSQEAFMKAYKALSTFRLDAKFSVWFFQILRNSCISYLRKRKARRMDQAVDMETVDLVSGSPTPERSAQNLALKDALERAIEKLTPARKEVLILREYQGFSYEEIAKITSISVEQVKSRLHYARKQLIEELKDYL
ncbi:MAG: sigma-70 family RNA polymerase sigma factor [Acidobacteria bacterium]|nr:sigma-70 family RNA polymerase sigma factor [Acidobacteriota bacterium]